MKTIDLHVHSTASDGSLDAAALAAEASTAGLAAVALTDHDTVAGVSPFMDAFIRAGIRGIGGIEISSNGPGSGEVHILGYHVPMALPSFIAGIEVLQRARDERNQAMIHRLQELGCPVSMELWMAEASGEILGRLHLARILVRIGWCRHLGEAFSSWIGRDGVAFMPKERWTSAEAVRFLRESGALPVLAHPGLYRSHVPDIHQFLVQLKDEGLVGIECIHSDHSRREVVHYQTLATRLDLLMTGGSDFHGTSKPGVSMGQPPVPASWLEKMDEFVSHCGASPGTQP